MKIILTLSVLFLLGSCTIEKRIHNRGWNVQWRGSNKFVKNETAEIPKEGVAELKVQKELVAIQLQRGDHSFQKGRKEAPALLKKEEGKLIEENHGEQLEVHDRLDENNWTSEKQSFASTSSENKEDRSASNSSGDGSYLLPILLICGAILSAALAIWIYLAIPSISGFGSVLLAVLGLIIFCTFAVSFLIWGIIALVRAI